MDRDRAQNDQLDAYIREADARLDRLEAQARAREAKEEMDDISGLRERRERLQRKLSDAKTRGGEAWDNFRQNAESEWKEFRRSVDGVQRKYSEWDSARERRFNARVDEAKAMLRISSAKDREVAEGVKSGVSSAADNLKRKTEEAETAYQDWRDRRTDEKLQKRLDDAEADLDEAYDRVDRARGNLTSKE